MKLLNGHTNAKPPPPTIAQPPPPPPPLMARAHPPARAMAPLAVGPLALALAPPPPAPPAPLAALQTFLIQQSIAQYICMQVYGGRGSHLP